MEGKDKVTACKEQETAGPYGENVKSDPTETLFDEMSRPLMRIHAA